MHRPFIEKSMDKGINILLNYFSLDIIPKVYGLSKVCSPELFDHASAGSGA